MTALFRTCLLALLALSLPHPSQAAKVVFISGEPSHGPMPHEHRAGNLLLAKALQRVSLEKRLPLIRILAAHADDVDDANIPRMLWYALEPVVPVHPEKALAVAIHGKIPYLQESVARRMVSGGPASNVKKASPEGGNAPKAAQNVLQRVARGFLVCDAGDGGLFPQPDFRNEFAVQTHPLSREVPCVLFRHLDVPEGGTTRLRLRASYHPHVNWILRVLANKKVIHEQVVSYETVKSEWLTLDVDLTSFAGEHVDLEVENGVSSEKSAFAFWSKLEVETKP